MLVFDEWLITYSIYMCIMCVMFVQRFESRGRHFTNLHIINIITVILNIVSEPASGSGSRCSLPLGWRNCINNTLGLSERRNFGPRFLRIGN